MASMEELRAIVAQLGKNQARFDENQVLFDERQAQMQARIDENQVRFDERQAQMQARIDENQARFDERQARFDERQAQMQARFDENEIRMQARFDENDARIQARFDESHARINGILDRLAEERAEGEKSMREIRESLKATGDYIDKLAEDFDRKYGSLGDRLGEITEIVVIPGVRPALSKLGRNFERIVSNKVIKKPDGNRAVEVDLLLDNCTEAMAVEIKTRLGTGMIDGHISRLEKLRAFETGAGIKNKALYGAVAGIIIDSEAQKYALKNGLYVIEILEDEYRLKAKAPAAGKVRTW